MLPVSKQHLIIYQPVAGSICFDKLEFISLRWYHNLCQYHNQGQGSQGEADWRNFNYDVDSLDLKRGRSTQVRGKFVRKQQPVWNNKLGAQLRAIIDYRVINFSSRSNATQLKLLCRYRLMKSSPMLELFFPIAN